MDSATVAASAGCGPSIVLLLHVARLRALRDEFEGRGLVLLPGREDLVRRQNEPALLRRGWPQLDREGGDPVDAVGPVGGVPGGRIEVGRLLPGIDRAVHAPDQRL